MVLSAVCWQCLAIAAAVARAAAAQEPDLLSRAERTNFEETSRYAEVVEFFQELQRRSPLVRMETFGKSVEGRDLPLAIIADPPVATPREAIASGKPIVFVMANIHAGEVEGKEAMQHVARRLVSGDLRPLADKLVFLIAPIYNADGNEKIDMANRSGQYGPIGGVGVRENSQGFDLNRDYIKLDAPESRALVRLFNEWDPHITVDLHTTNGTHHGYHLTYSIPLNSSIDPNIYAYHRAQMMPAIAEAVLSRHHTRMYYYGNASGGPGERGGRGGGRGRAGRRGRGGRRGGGGAGVSGIAQGNQNSDRPRGWWAFSHLPRAGQNYIGFRNRLTILSEAYSYLDFKDRVAATEAFVEEIYRYAADHGDEIRALTRRADEDTVATAHGDGPRPIGVEYEPRSLPEPVEILMGEVTEVENPRSGRMMTAVVPDKITKETMPDFGLFAATRQVPAARAYLFPPEQGLQIAVGRLRMHGIVVEELTQPTEAEAVRFRVTGVTKARQPFQGHLEVRLAGEYETATTTFPAGTLLVRTAQPLGRLAAYLLEPESDDGLVTWNFLDSYLEAGRVYPIRKLMRPTELPRRTAIE